ncbi:MAG: trimethylamine methyltransferase family protein, partial [Desulfobacterales bacterium]|nr:trimethylamine methyltransferase family protein [Desulfobacterales bacterium]
MHHSGNIRHITPYLTTVSPAQIREIIGAAFLILETTGCTIEHTGARDRLVAVGAVTEGNRVTVPRHVVQKALATVPKGFMMFNRDGEPAMDLTSGKSYFGSSTASPNQRHALDQQRKPTRLEDIRWGAQVADALENLDFVMPFGSAQDVPATSGDLYEFDTVVRHTSKPVFFCGYSSKGVEYI